MIYLKQSTASQEVPLGYFVDSTDGDTAETGLTIANTDIKVWKAGATTLASKNSGGATHISGGIYYAVLDATDTNTLGSLVIFVHVSGALTVRLECVVLSAKIYNSMIAETDNLEVDLLQIGGVAQSATDLKDFADAGYDPDTNKVEGVKTVDTTTTNTDMVGTDNAALASVATEARLAELDAANIPADVDAILTDTNELQTDDVPGLISGLNDVSTLEVNAQCDIAISDAALATATNLATVDTVVDAIKLKTDNLPADPASETNIDANETKIDLLQTDSTAIKAKTDNLPSGMQKNTALTNFEFFMVDSTDGRTGKTGLTITATRSIDGGAFASTTNSATELSNGIYKIDLSAADLNGDVITLKFVSSGADTRVITIKTNS